ncbi:phospholipase [Ekhidna sp.]|jgi:hypothetical protein|uniref:luciferase domain-containing protein n=2 Tax=Ekhidna sp. TaxID=2608089 RepID=UPI0032EAFC09
MNKLELTSYRPGEKPKTTPTNPHTQLDQQPEDLSFIEELNKWAFSLPYISREQSRISVPGAQAMCLPHDKSCQHCNAFMVGTEFAHFHPYPDYSMHLSLPENDVKEVIYKGWGEMHPVVYKGWLPPNFIMLYAPRNNEELEVAKIILTQSYNFALGNND